MALFAPVNADFLPGCIEEPDVAVEGSGCDEGAIGADRDGFDGVGVALEIDQDIGSGWRLTAKPTGGSEECERE